MDGDDRRSVRFARGSANFVRGPYASLGVRRLRARFGNVVRSRPPARLTNLHIYFSSMAVDVSAEVIANTRLSSDYNVLALAAPTIAAAASPGQFVMLKPSPGLDPLLRLPFSI